MSAIQTREPRIGDSVTYIRQGVTGYNQMPALVYRVEQGAEGLYPPLALTVYDPIYDNWSKKVEIQHRDHWAAGGGDDFDEYWCWPWEAEISSVYQSPSVTGRPQISGREALRDPDLSLGRRHAADSLDVEPTAEAAVRSMDLLLDMRRESEVTTVLLQWVRAQEKFIKAVASHVRAVALRDDLARRGAQAGEIIGAVEQQTAATRVLMESSERLPKLASQAVGLVRELEKKRRRATPKKPKKA